MTERRRLTKADASDKGFPYGEVVSYAPEYNRATLLSITQASVALFNFASFIVFLLESQGYRFMNVYLFTVIWGSVGAVLVIILQLVAYIIFMYKNKLSQAKELPKGAPESQGYFSLFHTREITIGWISSILSFLVISWQLISWLDKFSKVCNQAGEAGCPSKNSDPAIGVDPEYRIFANTMLLGTILSLVTLIVLMRTLFAHFSPLRVVTHLVNAKD
jgi:hypothetical protein